MSKKSNKKTGLQIVGIILFVAALGIFIASLSMSHFILDEAALKSALSNDYHYGFVEKRLDQMRGKEYPSSFAFMDAYTEVMNGAQQDILTDVTENKGLTSSDGEYWNLVLQDYKIKEIRFPLTRASSQGFFLFFSG